MSIEAPGILETDPCVTAISQFALHPIAIPAKICVVRFFAGVVDLPCGVVPSMSFLRMILVMLDVRLHEVATNRTKVVAHHPSTSISSWSLPMTSQISS